MTEEAAQRRADLDRLVARGIEELVRTSDPFSVTHTVQVTSFGGSGTTALCRHLLDAGVDLQTGPGQWPFKHQRHPPHADEVPEGFRVLYPVGDPRDAVLSVFRRHLQVAHYRALVGKEPDTGAYQRLENLETFIAGDTDAFALAEHLQGWLDHPPGYPVLFIRYDRLSEVWNDVCTFVGLAPDQSPLPVRTGKSDWRSSPPTVRRRLNSLYGELAARIDALPPAQLI